jgi:transporter family-2 protein
VTERWLALIVMVLVGGLVALQAPLNSVLGKAVGSFQAAAWAFVVGLIPLVALSALTGGLSESARAGQLAWYYIFGGGLIGAIYVASVLVMVRSLGAGGVTAATIAGQLTLSVALDHYGALGLPRSPVDFRKLLGVALLAAGTLLVVKD